MKKLILISLSLIGLIIIGRLIPHAPNFAPVTAVSMAAGLYLNKRYSWLVPIAGMLITDLIIGFYFMPIMIAVYASFGLSFLIGIVLRKNKTMLNGISATLIASVLFFIITNTAVWYFGTWYPHTLSGLGLAYTLAIPFFKSTLAGNLFYFSLIVGVFEMVKIKSRLSVQQQVRVAEQKKLTL